MSNNIFPLYSIHLPLAQLGSNSKKPWKHWNLVFIAYHSLRFPGGSGVKNRPASAGDASSIPGRSPGVGHGKLLQSSLLENSMDRGAWQATVNGVTNSQTQLSDWTTTISLHILVNSHLSNLNCKSQNNNIHSVKVERDREQLRYQVHHNWGKLPTINLPARLKNIVIKVPYLCCYTTWLQKSFLSKKLNGNYEEMYLLYC